MTKDLSNRNFPNIWETCEKIRVAVSFEKKEWAELLGLSEFQYQEFLRQKTEDAPAISVLRISDALGIPFESIVTGQVPFELVRAYQARNSGN